MSHYYAVAPQYASIAAASVTATTAATATTISTASRDRRCGLIVNTLDQDCMLTLAGADFMFLPATASTVLDLGPHSMMLAKDSVLGIYNLGTTPTSGTCGITLL